MTINHAQVTSTRMLWRNVAAVINYSPIKLPPAAPPVPIQIYRRAIITRHVSSILRESAKIYWKKKLLVDFYLFLTLSVVTRSHVYAQERRKKRGEKGRLEKKFSRKRVKQGVFKSSFTARYGRITTSNRAEIIVN